MKLKLTSVLSNSGYTYNYSLYCKLTLICVCNSSNSFWFNIYDLPWMMKLIQAPLQFCG